MATFRSGTKQKEPYYLTWRKSTPSAVYFLPVAMAGLGKFEQYEEQLIDLVGADNNLQVLYRNKNMDYAMGNSSAPAVCGLPPCTPGCGALRGLRLAFSTRL